MIDRIKALVIALVLPTLFFIALQLTMAVDVYIHLVLLELFFKCGAFLTPNIIRTMGLTAISKIIPFIPAFMVNKLAFLPSLMPIIFAISMKTKGRALQVASTLLFVCAYPSIVTSKILLFLASQALSNIKFTLNSWFTLAHMLPVIRNILMYARDLSAQQTIDPPPRFSNIEEYCVSNAAQRPGVIVALRRELESNNWQCPITLDWITDQSPIIMLLSNDPAGNIKATMIADNEDNRRNYVSQGNTDPLTRGSIIAYEITTISRIREQFGINNVQPQTPTNLPLLPSFNMSREEISNITFYNARQNLYGFASNITSSLPFARPSNQA